MSDGPQRDAGDRFRLQQFGLKDTSYERPNQNWVCGHLSEGQPCAVGPDAKGRCLATTECHPFRKEGRWNCTRRDSAAALCPCESGPLPDGRCPRVVVGCSPVRSIRAKRGRFVFALFALSVGILAFFLFGSNRADFVVPGDLTDAHAQVLKSHRAEDCAACHVAGSGDVSQWLRVAFSPPTGAAQNEKCLTCHLPALGHDAALPHSLPAVVLQQRRRKMPGNQPRSTTLELASFAPSAPITSAGQLACATCHQEHGGRHQDLTAMSDVSCQVCHKTQFQSFANGHPDFRAVPRERAGIIFDHAAHEPRIPGGVLECAQCHRPDPAARTMQFTGFESACAGCHTQGQIDHHGDQIRGDIHVVFQLPAMTPDQPGSWPKAALAPGTSLTPMMHFLISGDANPDALHALKSLDSDVQAAGSFDDWEADPAIKAQLVTAVKRVLTELTQDDAPTARVSNRELLQNRIARAAGLPENSPDVTALLDQLSGAGDQLKEWQKHCMPDLAQITPTTTQSSTAPTGTDDAATASWKPPKSVSAWVIDADAASVNYRPSHADAFDQSCLNLLASGAVPGTPLKIVKTMSDGDFLAALRGKLLAQMGGTCIRCHALQPAGDSFAINWSAGGHTLRAAGYVKFDHRPHLTLFADNRVCAGCHQVDLSAPPAAAFSDAVLAFSIGKQNHAMAPHNKAECTACHAPNGAPDACLTCHVYHMKK